MKITRLAALAAASAFALLLLCAPLAPAVAQAARATVTGTVKDQSGAAVRDARVWLVNTQQAVMRSARSDSAGAFRFEGVQPGSYELRVARADFDSRRVPVRVAAGEAVDVPVTLEVNRFSERVTVTAETGQVMDRERVAQQVNVINESSIQQRATGVLAQVADEEVGVNLQRTSPTIGGIFVRGVTGNKVGVYVDGVRYTTSAQRGGINTFFNMNEPSSLRAVEILRGPNSAQYGSDSLGGTLHLISRTPGLGGATPEWHGELNTHFTSADLSYGGNTLLSYGSRRFGALFNLAGRRVNTLRAGGGVDRHSSVERFLGLPSSVLGTRLTDTAFTQYGGTVHLNYAPTVDQQFVFHYQRSQQDGGKRYDQTVGGDGNLISDLKNLMLDFMYGRYMKQGVGFFDNASATFSYNIQREERVNQGGRGNPFAAITHQPERTKVFGMSAYVDKQLTRHNTMLFGGDFYEERVRTRSTTVDPVANTSVFSRGRVPDGAHYTTSGVYAQDVLDAVPNHVRISGAVRYNWANYRSRSGNSPIVNGARLFPDDFLSARDVSGRLGVVVTPVESLNLFFNYSRGFRAPNITDLGTLGLVGNGFEVNATDAIALGGLVGTTADANARSSGRAVSLLRSENSNSYDGGFRFHTRRFDTDLTVFQNDIENAIGQSTLILPAGAAGRFLGDQRITTQLASGAVIVPLSTNPVLVRTNFGDARYRGLEYTLDARLTDTLLFGGNFTMIRAEDRANGLPPNIEGGVPPATGFL
ncbi:MAG: TonB-dependent receptor, partial [Acidobacteria bacterium]|nr:TonB-dependent receptor [Acidobacteriota bacterium]